MKRFPKKRVVITGAGSGLGRAMSLEFAKLGWNVCVSDINAERAKETERLVTLQGGTPLVIGCDVTRPEQLESLAAELKKKWGGVDIVINNAGVAAAGFMEKIRLETWDWIITLNLKSVIYGCRAFIPLLEAQGGGHIVNVASNAGIASLPEMACYNVTKAGVISLSETLRAELTPKKIGVSVVAPTFFKTNLMDQFTSPDPRQRQMANAFFNKSSVTSEDVARHVIRAVKKNQLYVITQWDGKLAWFCKRLTPEIYFKVLGWIYKKGLGDRYLGMPKAA
ncbi:MAG: SDR family oxidoreductase [Desulfobacteraceae bacterium]|nr:SDR family oxidoreductase [Desulfobacteraceae bacterium]